MSVFVSAPTAFSGLGALQSRRTTEPFAVEEQYFQALAEAHERAASFARQRVEAARRQQQQQQQQREFRAKLLLQEHIAAASQAYTPRRSPYQTLRGLNSRVLHPTSDIIFDFGADDNDAYDAYAERMHRQSQAAFLERQKRAQQNNHLRSLFENQRRIQAAKVAELHRRRVEEVEQERRRKAQEQAERARRHVASRAADKERFEQFVQALFDAMSPAQPQPQGSDLERKNAIHRTSVPAPVKEAQSAASASASNSSKVPERASSPAPSVASDASDASLNSIASVQSKYESLRSGFTFPSALAFAPAEGPITPASAPTLPYNVTNAPVHAYEHALTNLLTQLDAIDSFGDEHVRDVRRSLVKSVEAELEALEEKKREAWRNQVEFKAATPSPVESFPRIIEPESIPAPESDLSNPISLVAARLSEAPESEDEEIKLVRENLLASLSAPAADDTALADSQLVQDELQVVVNLPSEPDFTVPITPQAPVEPIESPIKPTVEIAPEHEVVEAHIPTLVTEVGASEAVIEQPATEPVIAAPGSEPVLIESVPETEVVPASPTESEPVSVIAASEPEVITKVQDEIPSTFVQVYPDSDSDVDTDADLTSEIGEVEKKSGDEFELV